MKVENGKLQTIGKITFWLAMIIEITLVIVEKSSLIIPYEGQIFRLTFVLFLCKILTTRYSKKEWLVIFLSFLFTGIVYLINTRDEVVRMVALIAACKDVELKKLMKVTFVLTLAGSLVLMILSICGIGEVAIVADYGREAVEKRYTFGMGHPNGFHCMFYMLILMAMYVYDEKWNWMTYAGLLILNYIVYRFTVSNTGFIVTSIVLVAGIVFHYWKKCKDYKVIYFLSVSGLLLAVLLSMAGAAYGRDIPGLEWLDFYLNGRMNSAFVVEDARIWNWTLFGKPENIEYFDEAYIRLFYWYGIIPTIAYLLANVYLIYQSYRKKDYIMLIIVVSLALYNIMEAHIISQYLMRNILFVLMGYYWTVPFEQEKEQLYLWGWIPIRKG